MRVTLVDNLLLEKRGESYHFDTQPHLGLISLMAVLREGGHVGSLVDPKLAVRSGRVALDKYVYSQIAEEVLATEPDVVGLTSLGCNFIGTARVAAHIKSQRPDVPVLLGGPHASILDVPILEKYPQFDVVARGEAELSLNPLLDAVHTRRLGTIPGLSFREGGKVRRTSNAPTVTELDNLPLADYTCYPINDLGLTQLRVEAGRGCPFSCTFCSTASFFGRRYRVHSAERLCAELDRLHADYGVTHFAMTHDLFTVNKAKVHEFCDHVEARHYTWSCSARMDCVDAPLLKRMSEAGCRSIYYGVETGSPRMQREVSKQLDLGLLWPTLETTRQFGMDATTSFITGYPQETVDDQSQTLDLIGALWLDRPRSVTIQLHLLTPEPGTGLLDQFKSDLAWDGHISDFNLPALEVDDALVMRDDPEVFVNHHYYQGVVSRERNILVTSIHPLLYRLGFPLQRHLLARYPRRSLAEFFDALFTWWTRSVSLEPADSALLARFAADEWGPSDYLTSLVRYMLAATAPEQGTSGSHYQALPTSDSATMASPGSLLQLSRCATLLEDVHECPEILDCLANADAAEEVVISEQILARRVSYVLLPGSTPRTVRNLEVNDDTLRLLMALKRPHSRAEIADLVGASSDDVRLNGMVDDLTRIGVLEPAKSAPSPQPVTASLDAITA